MKTIADIAQARVTAQRQMKSGSGSGSTPTTPPVSTFSPPRREAERQAGSAASMAATLWLSMGTLFGKLWARENGEQPGDTWRALMRNATAADLTLIRNRLLREADKWRYPPNLMQFQVLLREARAEGLGLPSAREAFAQARRGAYTSGAVYEAGRRTGFGRLTGSAVVPAVDDRFIWPEFEANYLAVCAEIVAGAEFALPSRRGEAALPSRLPVTDADRARARPGIDQLRRRLGLRPRGLDDAGG